MGIKVEIGICVFCGAEVKCRVRNCICEECVEVKRKEGLWK